MARSSFRTTPAGLCLCVSLIALCANGMNALLAQEDQTQSETASESSKEALLLYAEAAGFQNNKQFDLAGEEWETFLKQHGSDPRATEARYNLAVCQLQQKDFTSAVENLAAVVKVAPDDFERLEDAYLNLGWCQYSVALANKPEYFAAASATFEALLKKYPKGNFRDQALFFGGESLYLQDKFKEAAESYGELVEKHTESDLHSDAMYALGVSREDLGQFEAAGDVYSKFLKLYPEHDLATEVKMRNGETILQKGRFPEAAKIFAEVAETDGFKSVDHARYRQAFCIAKQAEGLPQSASSDADWKTEQARRYVEAATIFSMIATDMKQSPYASEAAIAAGRAYFRAKEFEPAMKWFQTIKDSDSPYSPEAAHWMARILLDEGKWEEARDVVASVMNAAQDHPFFVSLKLDDADALYQNKETQDASVAAYLKIAQDHKNHRLAAKALYNAAYGAMEIGEFAKGLEYANEFEQRYAGHSLAGEVQKVVAECKLQLGEHDEAAKVYEKLAATGDKDGTKFELRRGLSLFLKKNYDGAIPVLENVYNTTASKDEKAESAYWLGRCFAGLQKHNEAIQAFEDSLAADSDWSQADEVRLNLARSLRRANRLNDALTTVSKLIEAYPNSKVLDQAHYRRGEFSYAQSNYAQAIESYSSVIEGWPDSTLVPFSLYGRGWARLRSGEATAGVSDFDELQKSFPGHELSNQTMYGRAMAQHQAGNHAGALESLEAYLATNPTGSARSDATYLKGLSLAADGKPKSAISTFEDLLTADSSYASVDKVLYELAWAYKTVDDDAKALETFSRLVEGAPDSVLTAEAYYHLGEEFYSNKQFDQAVKQYTAASELARTEDLREKAAYKLGWANYQSGQFEKALAAFDRQLAVTDSSNLAADAEFMRGESLFKQSKFDEAYVAYKKAKAKPSKNKTMRVLTLLHGAQSAAQLKQWRESSLWLSELQQQYPESAYLPQATYEQGWAQRNLGELDAAIASFKRVSSTSRNELGARARFMIGEVYFEKKDYKAAVLEFRRVMFSYGADKAPAKIKPWQAKAAFEAGRCTAVLAGQESDPPRRQQLIEGAKGFFQYVADKHPASREANAAKEQMQRLQPQRNRISNRQTPPGV